MRKGFQKFIAIAAAAVMSAGVLSFAACGADEFKTSMPQAGDPVSNGGFVVEQGEYYYFINGIESYTSDNTYGNPVKGALYRIKKDDVKNKTNSAERVIPSLMVAGTYDAGLYIYGDRVYYTTPNDVPDTISGETDTSYMFFKSAKLDGSDIKSYFTLDSNTVPYRIVSVDGTVYILYVKNNDIFSYNTAKDEETKLAGSVSAYVFNKSDPTDPTVYYTMAVNDDPDTDKTPKTFNYNQVYYVRADATEEPYDYHWDMDYIDEELDGEMPYTNLGLIVLDGRAKSDAETRFNHAATQPTDLQGHVYTLQSYDNGGLYYTDKPAKTADGSVGSDDNGRLYFLDGSKVTAAGKNWDSVKVNETDTEKDLVANAVNLSDTATSSALYYREADGHHYLYTKNDTIYRADVDAATGSHKGTDQAIAYGVSGATLVSVDLTSSSTYKYVWFTRSNGAGRSIERAVINGDPIYYQNLPFEDNDNKPYQPVKVLNLEHADSWYPFEIIGTDLFFADADNDVASTSFNYISTVSLANSEGKLMDNAELAAFTEKYNSIMSTDAKVGLLAKLSGNSNSKLSTALRYYFLTGETSQFDANIQFAVDNNKSETYLYTEAEQDAFYAFNNGEGYTDPNSNEELFKANDYAENGKSYRTYSYFVTKIGEMTEADETSQSDYWKTTLANYTLPEEPEETGLVWWEWLLIGLAIAAAVAGCTVVVIVLVRKGKNDEGPEEEKMAVDTTDDRDVDVYSEEAPEESVEEPQEEPTEEAQEEPSEESEEPQEEPEEVAEEPQEAPTEEPQAQPSEEQEAPAETEEAPAASEEKPEEPQQE